MAKLSDLPLPALNSSLSKYVLGFVGTIVGVKLLPKMIKLVFGILFSKFTFSIISEVVTVVIAGLLTEKAADKIGH